MDETQEPIQIEQAPPPLPVVDEPITINVAEGQPNPDQPEISILDTTQATTLTPDGQEQRASMIHYALQDKSPGVLNILNSIQQGKEKDIRTAMSYDHMLAQEKATFKVVDELTKQKGPLSSGEQDAIMAVARDVRSADPDTIVEKLWSHQYVKELLNTKANAVKEAAAATPDEVMPVAAHADQLIQKRQLALSIKQKFDKKMEDLPFFSSESPNFGKVGSFLLSTVPFYDTYQLHDSMEGSKEFTNSILPGNNLTEIRDFAFLLKPEAFREAVEKTAEQLWAKNPMTAMRFIDAIVNRPDAATWVDNAMGVVDVATVIPGTWVARGTKAAGSAAEKVIEKAPVAISEDLAKAGEHVFLSPEQLKTLQNNTKLVIKADQQARTANIPRQMAPIELRKAADAFPEGWSYVPSGNIQISPVGFLEPSRGIVKGEVSAYRVGEQRFQLSEGTVFVNPDELSKVPPGARIFTNADGELAVTRNENGRWTPTGDTISHSTNPEQGQVALNLGPARTSMGSKYYDNYSASAPITAVEKRANTQIEPYQMTPNDLAYIKNNMPGQSLRPQLDFTKFREASNNVKIAQHQYDEGRRVLDDFYESGNEEAIKAQQARLKVLKGELDNAIDIRNKTSVYNTHPTIAAAQQGLRAYMSSAFQALKTTPTATGTGVKADIQGSLTTMGRIPEAIEAGAIRKVQEEMDLNADPAKLMESFGKDLITLLRPNPNLTNSSALSREGVNRVSNELLQNSLKIQESLEGLRVQRLTPQDLKTAFDAAKVKVEAEYSTNFNNAFLDVGIHPHYDPFTNVYHVQATLGKTNATLFDTMESARNTALMEYKLPMGTFTVEQRGNGYVIQSLTPIDERDSVWSMMIPTNNQTPRSWATTLLNAFTEIRSAEDTTSELQRAARHVATHAPQELKAVIMDVVKSVKLKKGERGELRDILNQSRLEMDSQGRMGKWYDIGELETAYGRRFGKLPSEDFVKAYYSFKQLHDFDFMLRASQYYSHVTRWGGEVFTFTVKGADGALRKTDEFVGRVVDKIDTANVHDRGVLVVTNDGEAVLRRTKNDFTLDDVYKAQIRDMVNNQGYKIIQLLSPLKKPLSESTGNGGDIYYVITGTSERRPLRLAEGIEYREGTHIDYAHQHYIKQPKLTRNTSGEWAHAGDHTFRVAGSSEAEGRVNALKYETARKIMNSGDDAALDLYLRNNLPESLEDFKAIFTGPNGLDRDLPILYTSGGKNVFDTNPEYLEQFGNLRRYIEDRTNPEAAINSAYLQERANQPLMMVKDLGVDVPERFKLVKAEMLDPYVTLNRAIGQAVRSRYMDDYKILAAESFIKEFGKYIHNASEEALARNPAHFLYNGKVKTGVDRAIKTAIETYQNNVKNFIGMESEVGAALSHLEGKMQNALYKTLGADTTTKILETPWVNSVLIPTIKDPFSFAKAVAFHTRLGMFNPVQLWVQAQALSNVMAIAPTSGANGFAVASWLRLGGRYAMDDPAKLDWYAKAISKTSGWDRDTVKEAIQAYQHSGVSRVAGEVTWRDDFFDPKLFQTKAGQILDKATIFFTVGERLVRDTAFFTAFHEWKKLNPGKIVDQYAMGEIMNRFDTLALNMTRASNSSLQQGPFSLVGQFQTFHQRQVEQLLGKRLTWEEKARVMATYSALYGIPVGASTAVGIWDFYDDIRTYALNNGININDDYIKAMHDGILQLAFSKATGKDVDIGTRWGPGASSLGRDIINLWTGDQPYAKTFSELQMGPAGSTISGILEAATPFYRWVKGGITGQDYPLKLEDFSGMTKFIASLDGAQKWWMAYNVNKYYTKSGKYIDDVTGMDGFLMFTMGLTPQKFHDDFLIVKDMAKARGLQQKAEKEMIPMYQKMTDAMLKGDQASAEDYRRRVDVLAKASDMTKEQQFQIFLKASKGQESAHDQLNQRMLMNDPRASQRTKTLNNIMEKGTLR